MNEHWTSKFTPTELQMSDDLEGVVGSFEWTVFSLAGLMSIILFTIAASRSKAGDSIGAFFAFFGAIVVAAAPFIAKSFTIGG